VLHQTLPVEEILQGSAQIREVKALVLHLDDREIVVGVGHKHDVIEVIAHNRATTEDHLAALQQVDDFIQSSATCHTLPPASL
jgi:hypothetical protein